MKNPNKKVRLEYKVALIAVVVAIIMNILMFLFILLPIYSLVGESNTNNNDASDKLDSYSTVADVAIPVSFVLITTSIISGGLGLYRDVRKKSKK